MNRKFLYGSYYKVNFEDLKERQFFESVAWAMRNEVVLRIQMNILHLSLPPGFLHSLEETMGMGEEERQADILPRVSSSVILQQSRWPCTRTQNAGSHSRHGEPLTSSPPRPNVLSEKVQLQVVHLYKYLHCAGYKWQMDKIIMLMFATMHLVSKVGRGEWLIPLSLI